MLKKRICSLFLTFAMLLGLFLSVMPDVEAAKNSLTQTAATKTSITLAWDGSADFYAVYYMNSEGKESYIGTTAANALKIKNLSIGKAYTFRVYEAKSETGKKSGKKYLELKDAKTLPGAPGKPSIKQWLAPVNVAYFKWDCSYDVDGYELRFDTPSGKKISSKFTEDHYNVYVKPCNKGRFVCTHVRGYINIGSKKKYGSWSAVYRYASPESAQLTPKYDAAKKKGSVTFENLKVKDATKKVIYISNKEKSGFEKAKTLNSKKNRVTISKYKKKPLKTGKTYYFRIYYYAKVNGKTVKSHTFTPATAQIP